MKLVLAEARPLKSATKVMSEYLADALVEVKPDKLVLTGRDSARVCFVKFELLSASCIEYQSGEVPAFLINMARLAKIIKAVGESDILTLKTDDTYLHIIAKGASKTSYKLKMMEYEDVMGDPDDSFSCAVRCDSGSFKEALDKCNVLGAESMSFQIQRGTFSISSKDDNDDCEVEFSEDNAEILTDKKARGRYSTDYILKMKGAIDMCDKVDLDIGIDLPIQAVFSQPEKMRLTAIIAPRISED